MDKPSGKSGDRTWLWCAGILVALIIIAYLPASHAGFIWDDDDYVTNNPLITAPDGLKRIWFSLDAPSQYFPLVYSVFRLEHSLWGFNPAGYHWVNIFLHATDALLLWLLLKRLSVPGSWFAAAIFALHPVQVESVAWVTELKNVLSLFFFLLTLLAWVAFVDERHKQRWRFYTLALVCFALALFSKTTVCTLPLILLLVLWLANKPITRARLLQTVPFLLMSIAMGLVTIWWEHFHQGTRGATFSLTPLVRVLIAGRALWFYLGKLLWPVPLIFSYPRWDIQTQNPLAYVWILLSAAAFVLILFAPRFARRNIVAAALFFAVSLAPLLGFIMLYTFRFSFVADHYQYIASIGPISLLAAALTQLSRNKRWTFKFTGAGVLLLTLTVLTFNQCRTYATAEKLWLVTIQRNPTSFLAHHDLGVILYNRGDLDGAIAQYETALALSPGDMEAHNDLGNALLTKGRADDAIVQYRKALEMDPAWMPPRFNLAQALFRQGRYQEAAYHYRKVLAIDPRNLPAYCRLGIALLATGDTGQAISSFQQALKLDPNYAEARNDLANALSQQGQLAQAIADYEAALKDNPKDAATHYNLANALLRKGQTSDAIKQYEATLAINPNNADAQINLASALFLSGKLNDAISHFQNGLAEKPDDVAARYNLGVALLKSGRRDEAIQQFQKILALKPDYELARQELQKLVPQDRPLNP